MADDFFGDIDHDGTCNGQDDDMDGDGLDNGQDGDMDGDGVLNTEDTHAYGADPAGTGFLEQGPGKAMMIGGLGAAGVGLYASSKKEKKEAEHHRMMAARHGYAVVTGGGDGGGVAKTLLLGFLPAFAANYAMTGFT